MKNVVCVMIIGLYCVIALGQKPSTPRAPTTVAPLTLRVQLEPELASFFSAGLPPRLSMAAPSGTGGDGCCIQWAPGQANGCSTTSQDQCKRDAESVGANWRWHEGACVPNDNCR
jgi:hypothetical protein